MKRMIAIGALMIFLVMLEAAALGETVKMGQEYTLDGECAFTINNAKEYDVFFNQESGISKQWIVVSFDLLNWRNDSFFAKTETGAQIIYDDDFEFEADDLWAMPVGTYYMKSYNETIYVYGIDQDGTVHSNGKDSGKGLDRLSINIYGYDRFYDPITDQYAADHDKSPDDPDRYVSQDSSKTVLDPLVRRTYHYVFLVPDIVAEEEGNRELIFTVCDEEFSFRF